MTGYTERYVAAATRTAAEGMRDDIATELRASIEDQIEARMDAGENKADAERAVLVELGDPARLAADYTDRPLHLIGPRFYLDWLRMLKLLLWIGMPAAAIGSAVVHVLVGTPVGELIGEVIALTISVGVHVFFWTTLVFVIVERTGRTAPAVAWHPEMLPEPRPRGAGFADMVASFVFLVVVAGAVVWDATIGFVRAGGEPVPILAPSLWPWWISGLFVIMALSAALAVAVYRTGRWTGALAAVNTVLALAVAIPMLVLFVSGEMFGRGFVELAFPVTNSVTPVGGVIVGVIIAGIATWSILDAFLKAARSRTAA